ncbi:MAG: elongation factor 4 [Anaerolineales bacterium]|nr:MAG: elongation factor 4 [Anaerolineales bacterium]
MDQQHIRNFCIIAHIDHGKSTLADRLLEHTGTISPREMTEQVLDSMDLERERGVTIKASPVRMMYRAKDGEEYELNLIDTPGHVDFAYEVSRSLAACEGAVLVVDASQGIEAQTIANLYMALDHDLDIVSAVNKIDLALARPDEVVQELDDLIGIPADQVLHVSAREGIGVEELLEALIERIPPPGGKEQQPLRALVFDSHYDPYKGVVAYVRVVDGQVTLGRPLLLMTGGKQFEPMEIGIFRPTMEPTGRLDTGEVGYVATGLKNVRDCSVGDTITLADDPAETPLPGYRPAKPMVFAGFYPIEGEDYRLLKDALEKLQLNDASLVYEPETSQALNFGFRCGFLGLFHMEIVRERLEREYDLDLLATAPSVEYHVLKRNGEVVIIDSPADLPLEGEIDQILEPWMKIQIWTPAEYIGPVMELVTQRRGEVGPIEYLDEQRVLLHYRLPLSELIFGFYDQLKSRTRGYASLDYTFDDHCSSDLVKMDILVNKQPVDALSIIVHRDQAHEKGDALVKKMKELIPRQLFPVPIQAAIGKKVIARETVKALRKNVLAKCYGGDVTRKRKLLQRQKEGRKRLARIGSVEVPPEVFTAMLRLDD